MTKPFSKLGIKGLFLVWAYPQGSHRSQLLAQALGMPSEHIYFIRRQGLFSALLKYPIQAIKTPFVLWQHQPDVVFVQNPPIFGALIVYLWGLFTKTQFVIDSHTDAILAKWWQWTISLQKFLGQRAIITLVTNEHLLGIVKSWSAPAFILVDPPETYTKRSKVILPTSFNIVLVSTASYDEPIDTVIEVAHNLSNIDFHITGNFKRSPHHQNIAQQAPPNVHFTGYIPDDEFYGLLNEADIVMSLTTENHTIQSGASEALWLGKPIITSDWELLRSYYTKGSVLVDNSAESIQDAIETIQNNLSRFQQEILELREERRKDWWRQANTLIGLILQHTQ